MTEKISFKDETGEEIELYVLEETRINNMNYLLVTESDDESDEETVAYIMKDVCKSEEEEAVYEMVENDDELKYVSDIFEELLEDVDIE